MICRGQTLGQQKTSSVLAYSFKEPIVYQTQSQPDDTVLTVRFDPTPQGHSIEKTANGPISKASDHAADDDSSQGHMNSRSPPGD